MRREGCGAQSPGRPQLLPLLLWPTVRLREAHGRAISGRGYWHLITGDQAGSGCLKSSVWWIQMVLPRAEA